MDKSLVCGLCNGFGQTVSIVKDCKFCGKNEKKEICEDCFGRGRLLL